MLPAKSTTCPCGQTIQLRVVKPCLHGNEYEYDVCGVICPKCHRHGTGGNYRTGEVTSWLTAKQIAESEAEYQRQSFEADMNEWYGRGEW